MKHEESNTVATIEESKITGTKKVTLGCETLIKALHWAELAEVTRGYINAGFDAGYFGMEEYVLKLHTALWDIGFHCYIDNQDATKELSKLEKQAKDEMFQAVTLLQAESWDGEKVFTSIGNACNAVIAYAKILAELLDVGLFSTGITVNGAFSRMFQEYGKFWD